MSSLTKLVLLYAATSLLSQSAAAQAVVYPYNCDSTGPICHTDCVTAVQNICAGAVGPLTATQVTTVRSCTAKYVPYQAASDSKATCLANFQRILDGSNAAAHLCDGKTPGRVGGVLAMDANNQFVKGTSYAIFPANNNPNCVVHPSKIADPVSPRYHLFGTDYDCSAKGGTSSLRTAPQLVPRQPDPASLPAGLATRNAQAAICGGTIAGAVGCSAACLIGVIAT